MLKILFYSYKFVFFKFDNLDTHYKDIDYFKLISMQDWVTESRNMLYIITNIRHLKYLNVCLGYSYITVQVHYLLFILDTSMKHNNTSVYLLMCISDTAARTYGLGTSVYHLMFVSGISAYRYKYDLPISFKILIFQITVY